MQTQALAARISTAGLIRYSSVAASFLVATLLLATVGRAPLVQTGEITLRPDLALATLVLVVFGWAYVPVVGAALLIEAVRTPGLGGNFGFVLVDSILHGCVVVLLALAIRDFSRRANWGNQSDFLMFGGCVMVLPALPAFGDLFFVGPGSGVPPFLLVWLGAAVPLVAIVPAGIKAVEWFSADPRPPLYDYISGGVRAEIVMAQYGMMVVSTLFLFVERLAGGAGKIYPLFIAVFWMALTSGLAAATTGFLLAEGLLVAATRIAHEPFVAYDLQLAAAVLGASSLIAGTLTSARRDAEDLLRQQSVAMQRQITEMHVIRRLADSIIALRDESALYQLGAEAIGEQVHADQVLFLWIPTGSAAAQEKGSWSMGGKGDRNKFRPDMEQSELSPVWSNLETFRTELFSRADAPSGKLIAAGQDVHLHSACGIKSLLLHPFSFEPSGFYVAATLTYGKFHTWSRDELQFVAAICDQITIALQKMRLLGEREERSRAFARMSQTLVAETGESLFRNLVLGLAEAARTRGAYALLVKSGGREAQVLAMADQGAIRREFSFYIAGTPVEVTLREGTLAIQDNAHIEFPRFKEVIGLDVRGFAGTHLVNSKGQAIGTLSIFDDKPLEDPEHIASVLRLFAARAATEIERNERERELQESEASTRRLLETAHEGIWIVDAQGRTTYVNLELASLLGYAPAELAGKTLQEFVEEEDRHRAALDFQRQLAGTASQQDLRLKRRDGTFVWTLMSMSPIRTHDGEYRGVLAMVTDISERKRNEEELDRLVQERTAELLASNQELEAFCYSISHDLRQPLRAIDGFSRAVVEDLGSDITDDVRDHLMRVRRAANRMSELIDALLTLSRLSRVEMRREDVDLSDAALSILAELARPDPARANGFTVAKGLKTVGDARLLHIVLENLLSNAWKFSSKAPKPYVEFGLTKSKGKTCYFVRDNGIGFDMAYSGKLFKPFERLHSDSEFYGTGIGLATVARIIGRHGGDIWAEGEEGKGATFYFTLGNAK